jgi:eukaryotic-like serine/threonine-protein kinase
MTQERRAMSPPADRNLLFGLLALQTGMIDQSALVAAFHAWTRDKARSMAQLLIEQGAIDADDRSALEILAAKHLKRHGDDVEKSLADVPVPRSIINGLAAIGDADVAATLGHVCTGSHATEPGQSVDASATTLMGGIAGDGQRFRVLRPHARGGLGEIFVALDAELNREVALKQILDHHADDPNSRTRFILEAEITGGLEHPGIVPVYGLGSYGSGRPYYAMRFVRGDSLKDAIAAFHADPQMKADPGQRSLALRKLLRRFTDVCNAIEYAHTRGVIHRDIKPANVIVGKHGETLVIDWGLAKAVGRSEPGTSSDERTLRPSSSSGSAETLPGAAMGTPADMSPEQAIGDLDRLGPRSDVYSLGATLYSLLTGKPPFEGDDLGVVLQAVRKGEFPPPRSLDPTIDRALEAVCQKAMAADARDRYPTPKALAEDVERWAADEPVTAWSEPLSRRARRWARRNRMAVAVAAVGVLVALFGMGAVLVVQTKANADLTRSQAAVQARYNLAVDAINTFHTGVSEDFLLKQDQFKDVRDRLLKSASDFYGRLGALLGKESDPASRRALWQANFEVADLTGKVGNREGALAAHRQVLEAREALAAEIQSDPEIKTDVARSLIAVGFYLENTGRTKEAEANYRKAEAMLVALTPSTGEAVAVRGVLARCRSGIGWLLHTTGRNDEALSVYRLARADQEALAAAPGAKASDRRDLVGTINNIALLLQSTGKSSAAEAEYRAALAIEQKLADDNPTVSELRSSLALGHNNLGWLLSNTNKSSEATAEYNKALALYQILIDENSAVSQFRSDMALSHNGFALLLSNTGKFSAAEAEYRKALSRLQKLADDNPAVTDFRYRLALSHNGLGWILSTTAKSSEAAAHYHKALALFGKLVDDNPTVTNFRSFLALTHTNLGQLLSQTGKLADAEVEFGKAMTLQQKLADDNPTVTEFRSRLAASHSSLGNRLRSAGKFTEAEAAYRKAVVIQQKLADDNPVVAEFRGRLGMSHYDLGNLLAAVRKWSEAEAAYRKALVIEQKLVDDNPAVTPFRAGLARSHNGLGWVLARTSMSSRSSEADVEYRKALALYQKLADDNPDVTEFRHEQVYTYNNRGLLLGATGKSTEADAEYQKALTLLQKLADDNPARSQHQRELAASLLRFGNRLEQAERIDEAIGYFTRAEMIYRKLAEAGLAPPTDRDFLSNIQTDIADLLRRTKRLDEALAFCERSLVFREPLVKAEPENLAYRVNRAETYLRLGQVRSDLGNVAGAVAAWKYALVDNGVLKSLNGVQTFFLACCHASLAGLAGRPGSGVSNAEGMDHAEKAMAVLRQAVTLGYRKPDAYRTESALDPLRNRPDFQMLMMDLVFPAKPFAR